MGNWAEIPMDVSTKVAEHLEFHEDLEAFGGVCSRWRSAAKEATFRAAVDATITYSSYLRHHHRRHRVPWLMLPEQDDSRQHRSFHGVCDRKKVYRVSLPRSTSSNPRCLLSSRGWLLRFSGKDRHMSLFNPFSGSHIKLPTIPRFYSTDTVCCEKFILSADPATTTNYGVAVIFSDRNSMFVYVDYMVAIWWNGGPKWIRVGDRTIYRAFEDYCQDLAFYNGEFYAIDGSGQVLCLGSSKAPPYPGKEIPRTVANVPLSGSKDHSVLYLVQFEDVQFLVIYRRIRVHYPVKYVEYIDPLDGAKLMDETISKDEKEVRTLFFRAFEVDVETGEYEQVHSLGNKAVFMGLNSSFSIEACPAHGLKPNCIYFTDGYMSIYYPRYINMGQDLGIYNFTDGTFEAYQDDALSPFPIANFATPPIWVDSPTV